MSDIARRALAVAALAAAIAVGACGGGDGPADTGPLPQQESEVPILNPLDTGSDPLLGDTEFPDLEQDDLLEGF